MRLANSVCPLSMVIGLILVASSCNSRESVANRKVPQQSPQSETKSAVLTPSFKGLIQNVSMYSVPNNRQDLAVTLVVSVVNSGQPAIVNSWTLEVDSQDPSMRSDLEPVHVNGVVDLPGESGRKVDLAKEDLAIKAKESPVGTNSKMDGVLTFVLPKTSERELADNSSSFVLHFKDAAGNSYRTDKAVIGGKKVSTAAAR